MISSESLSFLKKLLDTPGPSGFEAAPAKVWREHARAFAKVSGDVAGNSLAEVNGGGKPTIMLAGTSTRSASSSIMWTTRASSTSSRSAGGTLRY